MAEENETENQRDQHALALQIAEHVAINDVEPVTAWLRGLLAIQRSSDSWTIKASAAIRLTADTRVVWPIAKTIALQIKRHGWDNQKSSHRWGMAIAALTLATFGGQSAGIAALGTAIGVPLWIVFGAGAMFARTLLHELSERNVPAANGPRPDTIVVDLAKDEHGIHRPRGE